MRFKTIKKNVGYDKLSDDLNNGYRIRTMMVIKK